MPSNVMAEWARDLAAHFERHPEALYCNCTPYHLHGVLAHQSYCASRFAETPMRLRKIADELERKR